MRKSPPRPRNAASAVNGSKSLNNRLSAPLSPSLRRRFSRSRFSLNSRSDLLRNLSRSINPNPRRISRILSLRPKNLSLKSKNISLKGFFQNYLVDCFLRPYADFSGVTSRKEFWLCYVAMIVASIGLTGLVLLLMAVAGVSGGLIATILCSIVGLGLVVPGLAISVRRLRDAGLSPWLLLVSLVPGLGALALLVMYCLPTKYEHEETETRFNMIDGIVTGGCVVLLGIGVWMSLSALGSLGQSGYDLGEFGDDEVIEMVEEDSVDDGPKSLGERLAESPGYDRDSQQYHYYKGNFSADGKDFPVMLAIVMSGDEVNWAIYKNIGYGTELTMDAKIMGNSLKLSGRDGGNEFTMSLTPVGSGLFGSATSGGTSLIVNLKPTSDTF